MSFAIFTSEYATVLPSPELSNTVAVAASVLHRQSENGINYTYIKDSGYEELVYDFKISRAKMN